MTARLRDRPYARRKASSRAVGDEESVVVHHGRLRLSRCQIADVALVETEHRGEGGRLRVMDVQRRDRARADAQVEP